MPNSGLLSTDFVAPGDRAPQWCEWVSQSFFGLRSDVYGDADFGGHLSTQQLGGVVMTKLSANRHRVWRDSGARSSKDDAYFKVVAPWSGVATVTQNGHSVTVGQGQWAIYDTSSAYQVDNPLSVDHLIVMVPKARLQEHGQDGRRFGALMARRACGAGGVSRMALESMRTAYLERAAMSEDAALGVGTLIVQLLGMSLMEMAGQQTAGIQRLALRDRIRAHVMRHLREPDLSVDSIATALNCSRRLLYNGFAGEGESVAGFIQRMRLEACVRDFQHGGAHHRAITDVAMSWGFGNASHFSRVFREHTGASPSEFRGNALGGSVAGN